MVVKYVYIDRTKLRKADLFSQTGRFVWTKWTPSLQAWYSSCKLQCTYNIMYIINPRRTCAARVTVVRSVCLSVKSHLTSGASVRPENAVTHSSGNEGQKFCGVFSETALLQHPLRCKVSVQCEGTHSLGIGFSWLKKANSGPKATWNTSQRRASLPYSGFFSFG